MNQVFGGSALVLLACCCAHAQHLYFTVLTHPGCPVEISEVKESKDFGFQSVIFRNDVGKPVESVHLRVTFGAPGEIEELVDSGHIYISLISGDSKRQDVFLARRTALSQKAQSDHVEIARAVLSVESVEFVDGTRWEIQPAVVNDPVRDASPK
jgi:hypothetical protein